MTSEPYLSARLHRAIAEDPRTAEAGVRATVRGNNVLLSGDVACEERRADLEAVVHEVAPDHQVVDDVRVVSVAEPEGSEELR
jgi:hypothetical protein